MKHLSVNIPISNCVVFLWRGINLAHSSTKNFNLIFTVNGQIGFKKAYEFSPCGGYDRVPEGPSQKKTFLNSTVLEEYTCTTAEHGTPDYYFHWVQIFKHVYYTSKQANNSKSTYIHYLWLRLLALTIVGDPTLTAFPQHGRLQKRVRHCESRVRNGQPHLHLTQNVFFCAPLSMPSMPMKVTWHTRT